jgi:hypothetical protein
MTFLKHYLVGLVVGVLMLGLGVLKYPGNTLSPPYWLLQALAAFCLVVIPFAWVYWQQKYAKSPANHNGKN